MKLTNRLAKLFAVFILISFGLSGYISTSTGKISLSAAEFASMGNSAAFHNGGYSFQNTAPVTQYFIAPLQLPDGSTITKIIFYYRDESPEFGQVALVRNNMNGTKDDIAYVDTFGNSTVATSSEVTLSMIVDNSVASYFLSLFLPADSNVELFGVIIEYSYPIFLPSIFRN